MNHYIKSIAAKNLHLMEVIQPRLASRFEPTPQRFLPAESSLRKSVSRDVEPINSADQFAQDHEASNHYAPDSYTRVAARNIALRSPAAGNPDSPGPEALVDAESTVAARPQRKQDRTIQPIFAPKERFSSLGQGDGDLQANFETSRQSSLPSAGMISDRSSILGFSGLVSSPETAPALEAVQKVTGNIGLENRSSREEPSPSATSEEEQTSRKLSYERKSTSRTSEGTRPEEIVPISDPEQKQNLSLKAVDLPVIRIMQREEEIVPMASIEDIEKKRGIVGGVRHETVVPIARIKPLSQPVSPGMVAAQPYVKSYFKKERNKILDRAAKPEQAAPVQVTIGRIEIRATPTTAIPQRKHAEPSVMSLEDYLKIKRGSL
jgi:hypothetical protein